MILLDPKTAHRFQPDPGAEIVYLLKVPTVADRPKYRHAVRTAGGKQWTELQMLGALADGVRAILSEPDDEKRREELLAEIDAYRARMTAFLSEIRAGEIDSESDPVEFLKRVTAEMSPPPMVKEIERVVLDHYPPYAALVADREVYHEIAGRGRRADVPRSGGKVTTRSSAAVAATCPTRCWLRGTKPASRRRSAPRSSGCSSRGRTK